MSKIKQLFKNWKILLLIIFLVFAIVALRPNPFNDGVMIKAIAKNSSASLAGIENPKQAASPMSKEIIKSINNVPIKTVEDYYEFVNSLAANRTVRIKTNKKSYVLYTRPLYKTIRLNETEEKIVPEIIYMNETIGNETVLINKTINKTVTVQKVEKIPIGMQKIGLNIAPAPTTNIRKGLDLQGGTRVLLQPEEILDSDLLATVIESLGQRLNVYGVGDVSIKEVRDKPKLLGEGNQYILVEIAGASEEEVKNLLAKQGKFEAKLQNQTVFVGGEDITYVCRTADCSGINPNQGCGRTSGGEGYSCAFMFSISLSQAAADRMSEITKDIPVEAHESGKKYLTEPLILFLDNKKVDQLNVASDLKGRSVKDIAISGGGAGPTEYEAQVNTLSEMKRLQTILITGSLPVKLNVVKTDNISPKLGAEFIKNAILLAILAIFAVAVVLLIRYRHLTVAVAMVVTSLSEMLLLLGVAAIWPGGWNIDLAAIAGIIVAVGTGVDDQIVITDETLSKETEHHLSWARRLKNAFFIILAAYFTTLVAMFPLLFAGAGLLRGFALTTMIGITIGVFITRPAYAEMIRILLGE